MPTVLRAQGFRFFFYSNEGSEPPHVHVERADGWAKYWLAPVALAASADVGPRDLRQAGRIVTENAASFLEAWHEYFGK